VAVEREQQGAVLLLAVARHVGLEPQVMARRLEWVSALVRV
jgi:hypothetical protein